MSKVFIREFGVSEVRVEGAFEKNVFDGFDSFRTFWAVGTWGVCSTPHDLSDLTAGCSSDYFLLRM